MLCPNDHWHILAKIAIELSREAGYSLFYMPLTLEELTSLITAFSAPLENPKNLMKMSQYKRNPIAKH